MGETPPPEESNWWGPESGPRAGASRTARRPRSSHNPNLSLQTRFGRSPTRFRRNPNPNPNSSSSRSRTPDPDPDLTRRSRPCRNCRRSAVMKHNRSGRRSTCLRSSPSPPRPTRRSRVLAQHAASSMS